MSDAMETDFYFKFQDDVYQMICQKGISRGCDYCEMGGNPCARKGFLCGSLENFLVESGEIYWRKIT